MSPAKPAPLPTALSAPYWVAAARGELSAPWCEPCSDWVFPPRPRCPRCGGAEMGWRTPGTTGEVVTFSVVHQAAYEAYRDDQPYVVAIVALDGGPQLMTNLVDVPDLDAIAVGQRVELSFEKRGSEMQIPQFRPTGRTRSVGQGPGPT